jgi:hypothetical protein
VRVQSTTPGDDLVLLAFGGKDGYRVIRGRIA